MSLRSKWFNAIMAELAPDAIESILGEWLGDKSPGEAYQFLIQHRNDDWYDLLPQKAKVAIRKLPPIDLDWLDTKWVIQAIAKVNPKVASLIMGSPQLQAIVTDKAQRLRERIARCV